VALLAPPAEVWRPLEALAPGIYAAFLNRLVQSGTMNAVKPTSWWRSLRDNRLVGGLPDSQHLLGLAADLAPDFTEPVAQRLNAVGLVAVDEGDHVHVQLLPPGLVGPVVDALAV